VANLILSRDLPDHYPSDFVNRLHSNKFEKFGYFHRRFIAVCSHKPVGRARGG
jgi:hypothetical protein